MENTNSGWWLRSAYYTTVPYYTGYNPCVGWNTLPINLPGWNTTSTDLHAPPEEEVCQMTDEEFDAAFELLLSDREPEPVGKN